MVASRCRECVSIERVMRNTVHATDVLMHGDSGDVNYTRDALLRSDQLFGLEHLIISLTFVSSDSCSSIL